MEKLALELYQEIFKTARFFLNQTDLHTIHELHEHNDPTYDDIAKSARGLSMLMETIAANFGWDQERIALNAKQAALVMSSMALAITEKDQEGLMKAKTELEQFSFI